MDGEEKEGGDKDAKEAQAVEDLSWCLKRRTESLKRKADDKEGDAKKL